MRALEEMIIEMRNNNVEMKNNNVEMKTMVVEMGNKVEGMGNKYDELKNQMPASVVAQVTSTLVTILIKRKININETRMWQSPVTKIIT